MKLVSTLNHWSKEALHLSLLKKKRLQWVDYLRGIAIILVVYHHVRIGIERSDIVVPAALVKANMIFYSFRMPLFFMLSGIFINRSLLKKSASEIAGIKFEKLLYPYFIWVFIQISLQLVFVQFTNTSRGFIDFTYAFYNPRYLDQFWYLPALFNATMFYLLIKTKLKPNAWQHLGVALALYFSSPYFQGISMMSDWMEFYIFFAVGDTISKLFFKEGTQKFFNNIWSFILIIPVFIAAQLYYLKNDIGYTTLLTDVQSIRENYLSHVWGQTVFLFIAFVGCITMFKVAFLLQRIQVFPFLRVMGYHSLQIYVMHVIIAGCTRILLFNYFGIANPYVLLFSSIAIGVLLPIVIYNLLIKDNVGWFLFSYHKRKKPAPVVTANPTTEVRTEMIAS
jgi:fucose 4-O-acetylase-like acetyltransferase